MLYWLCGFKLLYNTWVCVVGVRCSWILNSDQTNRAWTRKSGNWLIGSTHVWHFTHHISIYINVPTVYSYMYLTNLKCFLQPSIAFSLYYFNRMLLIRWNFKSDRHHWLLLSNFEQSILIKLKTSSGVVLLILWQLEQTTFQSRRYLVGCKAFERPD